MFSATGVSTLTPPAAVQDEVGNALSPREAFLNALKKELDVLIGIDVFVPAWNAILRDCEVIGWEKEEGENTYRLTLDSAYIAAAPDNSGKTWQLEKEIVLQFVPENNQILFPRVKEMLDLGLTPNAEDIAEKSLNAIWAWEKYVFVTYTGVGYSMRWNADDNTVVSDNINDAPTRLQFMATPRVKTLPEVIQEWNDRGRAAI